MSRLPLLYLCFFTLSALPAQEIFDSARVVLETTVHFDFGQDTIRPDADSVLRAVAARCQDLENYRLEITAHTDAVGTNAANFQLSQRRAAAVRDFLQQLGVQPDTFLLAVFGELKPVADNRSEEGRQRNRRATLRVVDLAPMTYLEGRIQDAQSGQGIAAELIVRTKTTRDSLLTDTSGFFRAPVPVGQVVGVDVFARGYFLETQMLKIEPGKLKPLEIQLKPALPGETAEIKNLYFVGNQDVLLKSSEPELPKLLRFMQLNEHLKIEIAGHVNFPNRPPVTKTSWEYGLSVRRAKRVYEYLLQHGIPAERMTFKGYGNWEMRYPRARTEKEQALNRRVEIRILESGKTISREKSLEDGKG